MKPHFIFLFTLAVFTGCCHTCHQQPAKKTIAESSVDSSLTSPPLTGHAVEETKEEPRKGLDQQPVSS